MSGSVVITGIGPVCRAALSVSELSSGVARGDDWYDPTKYLGPRGFKYYTPATRYVLSAAEIALKDAGLAEGEMPYPADRRGVFVGTNFGVHEVLREFDDFVLSEGSDGISPATAPNFSLNVCASYVSIKRPLHAFNVTLSSALVAGLEAIIAGARAIRMGRADLVLAGATEDRPPAAAAKDIGLAALEPGAAMLVLESEAGARARGARIYAAVGSSGLAFAANDRTDDLARSVNAAFARVAASAAKGTTKGPASSGSDVSQSSGPGPAKSISDAGLVSKRTGKSTSDYDLSSTLDAAFERITGDLPAQDALPFWGLTAPFGLNSAVQVLLHEAAVRGGVALAPVDVAGGDGRFVTVSPVLGLMKLATLGCGLAAATSPQGHVALLALERTAS